MRRRGERGGVTDEMTGRGAVKRNVTAAYDGADIYELDGVKLPPVW